MNFYFEETCLEHDPGPRHPESPDRLRAIRQELARRHGVAYVGADPAARADLEAAHDPEYVAEVEAFCESGGGSWDPDTVATEATWPAATTSAGLAAATARAAIAGDDGRDTPFSLGRPPGHRAVADDAMGFCFPNNVAVATEHALRTTDVERVAIFDWDVHHGNGTQEIFDDRGDVFFASFHERGLYPGTGDADETGHGAGAGTTLNVPFPPGAGDAAYLRAVEDLLRPAFADFDPGLVIVSAGFDAHRHDPISRMHVTTEGYGALADRVRSLATDAGAGLGFVLEGGYGLDSLAEGVGMIHEVFDGREPHPEAGDPGEEVEALIETVAAARQGAGSK